MSDATEEVLRREIAARKERAEFYVHLLRHDIGNYVSPPISNIEVLLMGDGHDAETRDLLEACRRQLGRVRELLHQVDTLATLDRVETETIDLNHVVATVVDDFQASHPGDLVVRTDLPDGVVAVCGVPILDQILVNLLNNALRHCPHPVTVDVTVRHGRDHVVLDVADDGPGVPDDMKGGLFEYGGKGGSSTGKGLGLYLVRTIAGSVGGEVECLDRVQGDTSKGACFRVRLPRPRGTAPAPKPAWAVGRGDGKASA